MWITGCGRAGGIENLWRRRAQLSIAENAARLAAKGFRVFNLRPLGKEPAVAGFYDVATSDPAIARQWWSGSGANDNIGVLMGEGLIAIDVDVVNKPGDASLSLLDLEYGLPDTLTARTPTGGRHLFYKVPAAPEGHYFPSAIGFRPGIDVKGWHSYVAGVGSRRAEGVYAWDNFLPIADLPPSLINDLRKPLRPRIEQMPLPDWADDETAENLFGRYLDEQEFTGNDRDDHHLVELAGRKAGDFGVTAENAADILCERFGLGNAETLRVVHGCLGQRTQEFGSSRPVPPCEVFETIEMKPPAPAREKHPQLWETFGDIVASGLDNLPAPLVKGWLDEGMTSVWYGPSNAGKTFVVLDLAIQLAAGQKWNDCAVRQGLVFYCAAEAGRGMVKRCMALAKDRGFAGSLPLAVMSKNIDLLSSTQDRDAIIEGVRQAESYFGMPCKLIVIDTLNKTFGGQDENESTAMGTFVRQIDALRERTGAHVAIIHHTGKDTGRGARGHSSLRAAVDTEVEITRGKITVRKQRDMEYARPIGFSLRPVQLGTDSRGDEAVSCVVDLGAPVVVFEHEPGQPGARDEGEANPPAVEAGQEARAHQERIMEEALAAWPHGMTALSWTAAVREACGEPWTRDTEAMRRARSHMVASGRVAVSAGTYVLVSSMI